MPLRAIGHLHCVSLRLTSTLRLSQISGLPRARSDDPTPSRQYAVSSPPADGATFPSLLAAR
uniref:Uncharacterized protein n=1 Tax=Streptomyces sp. F12 TaxID=1436084 RepID=V9Z6J5_9ACTN|nr:hypothetical protein pFRL6_70 [Streptomyces sp. F12]